MLYMNVLPTDTGSAIFYMFEDHPVHYINTTYDNICWESDSEFEREGCHLVCGF